MNTVGPNLIPLTGFQKQVVCVCSLPESGEDKCLEWSVSN